MYGAEADPYGYAPPAGNPAAAQAFPGDALYGRGPTPRQGYPAPPEPKYDDVQNTGLQPATARTSPPAAQVPSSAAPPARRDRDSEPRERERERDHRDHRPRRPEPERDDKHADRNRHRHR